MSDITAQDLRQLLRGFAEDLAQSLEGAMERATAKGMYDAYATLQMLTVPATPTVNLVAAQAKAIHEASHNKNIAVRRCPYPVCQQFNTWCQEWDLPEEATGG